MRDVKSVLPESRDMGSRTHSLDESVRSAIERMAGDETLVLGGDLGAQYRVYRRPGLSALKELAAS